MLKAANKVALILEIVLDFPSNTLVSSLLIATVQLAAYTIVIA